MKHKSYKIILIVVAICCLGTTFAQKFDKKFTESFKVNKDVEVAINATNTDINVTSWNKNEVQVDAFIEIVGLTKEEAEKYFKNWDFEALGNSKTVKITSKGSYGIGAKKNFVFFNDFDFEFPEIEFPNIDAIVLPDMDFDFDFAIDYDDILKDIEDIDETIGKNGKYEFQWNDGKDKVVIKSRKDWEKFKKTKKYKELKQKLAQSKEKLRKKFAESKEKMKNRFAKAKIEYRNIDKEKIKKELVIAKERLKNMKFNFHSNKDGKVIIDGKEVKIKKKLNIKVPKNATFNLNTRHCKVKLPNTVASGNVKYGIFNANDLVGGRLTIDYSKVAINNLNACTLFLNNVTDAKIASVTNTTMNNNSSGVRVYKINKNVRLSDKFGELVIDSFHPNFGEFVLDLQNTQATIVLNDVKTNFNYNIKSSRLDNKSSFDFLNGIFKDYEISTVSEFTNNKSKNNTKLTARYSSIIFK